MSKKTTTTTTTTVVTTVEDIITKKDTTYYVFVLDRSGSMSGIQKATIDNYNEQIGTLKRLQKEYPDQKYIVSLVIFDDVIETVIDNKPVDDVQPLTESTYVPRGMTALRDAMGTAIANLKIKHGAILEEKKDSTEACIVVLTDGEENASKEYTAEKLKTLVNEANAKKNWSVMFVGANEKSVLEAKSYGVASGNIANASYSNAGMYTASVALGNIHSRRAFSKTRGVELDTNDYMSFVSDTSGMLKEELDLSDIDSKSQQQSSTTDNAAINKTSTTTSAGNTTTTVDNTTTTNK